MDVLIWINTLVLIFAAVVMLIMIYMSLHEVRKSNEALSKSNEALSRVERLTLATLERIATQQGSTT